MKLVISATWQPRSSARVYQIKEPGISTHNPLHVLKVEQAFQRKLELEARRATIGIY